jgi:hypothetical protein
MSRRWFGNWFGVPVPASPLVQRYEGRQQLSRDEVVDCVNRMVEAPATVALGDAYKATACGLKLLLDAQHAH